MLVRAREGSMPEMVSGQRWSGVFCGLTQVEYFEDDGDHDDESDRYFTAFEFTMSQRIGDSRVSTLSDISDSTAWTRYREYVDSARPNFMPEFVNSDSRCGNPDPTGCISAFDIFLQVGTGGSRQTAALVRTSAPVRQSRCHVHLVRGRARGVSPCYMLQYDGDMEITRRSKEQMYDRWQAFSDVTGEFHDRSDT